MTQTLSRWRPGRSVNNSVGGGLWDATVDAALFVKLQDLTSLVRRLLLPARDALRAGPPREIEDGIRFYQKWNVYLTAAMSVFGGI
jgi:hypothetical protein